MLPYVWTCQLLGNPERLQTQVHLHSHPIGARRKYTGGVKGRVRPGWLGMKENRAVQWVWECSEMVDGLAEEVLNG